MVSKEATNEMQHLCPMLKLIHKCMKEWGMCVSFVFREVLLRFIWSPCQNIKFHCNDERLMQFPPKWKEPRPKLDLTTTLESPS